MPVAVPFRPRAAGWRALLVLALASASLPAAAQSMACGTYKDSSGNTTLTIESEGHGFLSGPYQATEQLRIARQEDVLGTGNLSTGQLENWYFSDNNRTINTPYREFTRERSAACTTMPEPIEGGCVMNTSECLEALPEAEPGKLHAWCAEGVGAACTQLLETYQRQAKDTAPAPARAEPPMPEICKESSASFNAEGCRAIAEVIGAEMMGKAVLGLQHSVDPALPSAQLDELAALCRQQHGETFCGDVAEALWSGGRLLQANEALQLSCAQRAEGVACGRAEALAPLASVPAAALAPVPATTLPCGSFEAGYGVLSQLRFLDGGLVEAEGRDQRLRASLQDGRILIHRDVGSDFVLQPLKNGNLASVDGGNRFAYYERTPGTGNASCAPPVAFVEIPLPLDCPALGRKDGAKACCTEGKLLGCKVAGEALFNNEQWAASLPYFETLCRAGVREGCVALAAVYARTADPKIPQAMAAICAKDGKGTHVACDVDATRNWPALKAEAAP
ncbi:hypothetical protein CCR98_20410 [Stenotrophomonas sp. WZN-1]|uniref:hypothetical protein n=1 Tax=Stenotrophomonas sp. WZN-1 TaxID=2005046 RepID=UPI000B439EFA|nr:hypothetical protein [Stenotrophomonas sp. WZN-1]ARZ76425.1 hypothetical protein CCR98_20410 [Stenotrophomonas sp. WZN-1]